MRSRGKSLLVGLVFALGRFAGGFARDAFDDLHARAVGKGFLDRLGGVAVTAAELLFDLAIDVILQFLQFLAQLLEFVIKFLVALAFRRLRSLLRRFTLAGLAHDAAHDLGAVGQRFFLGFVNVAFALGVLLHILKGFLQRILELLRQLFVL